jgi:hypothetical protein
MPLQQAARYQQVVSEPQPEQLRRYDRKLCMKAQAGADFQMVSSSYRMVVAWSVALLTSIPSMQTS